MNLEFGRMRIENLLSVGPAIEFDYNQHSGLNYVSGINIDLTKGATATQEDDSIETNGAGKSNIFVDAPIWAMFGKTLKAHENKFIPNRRYATEVDTSVELDIKRGDTVFRIIRVLKKKSVTSKLTLLRDGVDITKGTIRMTQDYIEKEILKSTYNIYKNCIVLTATKAALFLSMSRAKKREFIEEVFDMSIYGDMFSNTKKDYNKLNAIIRDTQSNIMNSRRLVGEISEKQKIFIEGQHDKQSEIAARVNKLEDDKTQAQESIDSLTVDAGDIASQANSIDVSKYEPTKIARQEIEKKLVSLKGIIRTNTLYVSKFSEVLGVVGDCCLPKVKDKFQIDTYEEEINSDTAKYNAISEKVEHVDAALKSMSLDMIDRSKLIDDLSQLNTQINSVRNHIINIESEIGILIQSGEVVRESDPFIELLEKHKKEIDDDTALIHKYATNLKYMQAAVDIMGDSGVKRFAIRKLVKLINSRIQYYLNKLNSSYVCTLNEELDTTFSTASGECSYENFSGGESVRIQMALLFSFRDILQSNGSLSPSALVLDEFLDSGISANCIRLLIEILQEFIKSNQVSSVFVVSHRDCPIESEFDNILCVIKENDFSRMRK